MAPSARDPIEAPNGGAIDLELPRDWPIDREVLRSELDELSGFEAASEQEWEAAAVAWWQMFDGGQVEDRRPRMSGLGSPWPAQPPEPWPGELEQARVCWRKHGEPRRVRWQFNRWRPCADCLDDLRRVGW